jgi:serine/threonine-protein kinase HipA
MRLPDGEVGRVHQEDLCQALSVPPGRKYERNGGPGLADIFPLLANAVGQDAVRQFVQYLVFHYTTGSSDSHAKNFSIVIDPDGQCALAPLYDAASVLYYEPVAAGTPHGLAFKVGGESAFGRVLDRHWRKMAALCRVDADMVVEIVHDLASRVPDAMRDSLAEAGPVAAELAAEMLPLLGRLCWSAAHSRPWESALR